VHAANSRGGLAISGATGYSVLQGDHYYPHAITFGSEFEPVQLSKVTQTEWVKLYAK